MTNFPNRDRFVSNKKSIVTMTLLGFALLFVGIFSSSVVETVQAGWMAVYQRPVTGTLYAWTEPGMYGQFFGSVTKYKKEGTIWFSEEDGSSDDSVSVQPVIVRFADGGIAAISGNARFELPNDDVSFINIHERFRGFEKVATNLIKPVIREALIVTASLMTAEESYSGRRAEFAELARDQVLNGVYLTESHEQEVVDPITNEKKVRRVVAIRTDPETGERLRRENPLKFDFTTEDGLQHHYELNITQFVIDKDFDYEAGILDQIKKQRAAYQQAVTAKANAERAKQDAMTAIEEGKARVVTAQYEEEEKKIRAVVEAQKKLDVAKLDRKAAAEFKQEQILRGQGEAARRKLVMQADGALDKKLEAQIKIQGLWADAFSKFQGPIVPSFVAGGNGDGSPSGNNAFNTFMQVMAAKTAQDLNLDMKVKGQK